jgi:ketopantoate reductase
VKSFRRNPNPVEVADTVARNTASNRNSMLQDLERRTATEGEAIHGAVVQAAAQAGLEAPFNEITRRIGHGLVAKQKIV